MFTETEESPVEKSEGSNLNINPGDETIQVSIIMDGEEISDIMVDGESGGTILREVDASDM